MSFAPTAEQQTIIDEALLGEDMIIEAGAGAGKTSTLRLVSEALIPKKGIYFAYNKAIATDAQSSFPPNVKASTAHSLAYAAVITQDRRNGSAWRERLKSPRMPSRVLAQRLGTKPLKVSAEKTLSESQVARLAWEMVNRFCRSADEAVAPWHLPFVEGIDHEVLDELKDVVCTYADKIWADLSVPSGELKFDHDHYLKLWGLSHPRLSGQFIMLDEAQDANPVIAQIVEEQTQMQRILVGDACQAIYGWRGAVDAMAKFTGKRLYLSQSFRFGQPIADEANKWLRFLESPLQLTGFDQLTSVLGSVPNPVKADGDGVVQDVVPITILCRTNGGAMDEVISAAKNGLQAALVGGGDAIERLCWASKDLMNGKRTEHPDLFMFESWAEVREYAEAEEGGDLKIFIKMVDRLGISAILTAVRALVSEQEADVIVSTAHKAKGREWNNVRVSSDFREPKEVGEYPTREEAMLAYVTVTRAKRILDRTGLAWVDRFVPGGKPV